MPPSSKKRRNEIDIYEKTMLRERERERERERGLTGCSELIA